MKHFLQWFNFTGVIALAVLCALQWRVNGRLDERRIDLEKTKIEQATLIAERDQRIREDAADLEELHRRLTLAESQLKDLDTRLSAMTRNRNAAVAQNKQLMLDRDNLKAALEKWMTATKARDVALKDAVEQLTKRTAERNDAVQKFNDLANKYNAIVNEVNRSRKAATQP